MSWPATEVMPMFYAHEHSINVSCKKYYITVGQPFPEKQFGFSLLKLHSK